MNTGALKTESTEYFIVQFRLSGSYFHCVIGGNGGSGGENVVDAEVLQ